MIKFFKSKLLPNAFGMDISAQAVKIVQLSRRHRGITLDIIDSCPLDSNAFVDGEIKNQLALHDALTSLLNKYKVSLVNGVVTSLSEAQTFLETINVPKEANKTFDVKLREVLPQYLPLVLEETYYDAKIVATKEDNWRVCVGAASIKQVKSYLELFRHLKITPLALDIEAGAVARAVLQETVPAHALAIIDLGSTHASMIIIENGTVQFTISMPIAGKIITERIASELNLTEEQAEKAKRTCGLHPEKCEGIVLDILHDMVRDLSTHVIDASHYYEDHFPEAGALQEILLCGGGAAMPNIDTALHESIKLPVRIANPWENIDTSHFSTDNNSLFGYTTALGLALRGRNINIW